MKIRDESHESGPYLLLPFVLTPLCSVLYQLPLFNPISIPFNSLLLEDSLSCLWVNSQTFPQCSMLPLLLPILLSQLPFMGSDIALWYCTFPQKITTWVIMWQTSFFLLDWNFQDGDHKSLLTIEPSEPSTEPARVSAL